MEQPVYFSNHLNEKLSGTLHLPDEASDKGIVIGHCFTCSRHTRVLQQISHDLSKTGFMTLRFDFSGNGQSEGNFAESSYTKNIADMKAAIAFISEQGANWIGLAGHSLGAAIAILTAAQLPAVGAVCSLAGRLSSARVIHFLNKNQTKELQQNGRVSFTSRGRSLQLLKEFFDDADQHNLPKTVAALTADLLIIHGEKDEIVPVKEAYRAHKLNPDSIDLAVIPEADHMFSDEKHRLQVAALVVDWFVKQADEAKPK